MLKKTNKTERIRKNALGETPREAFIKNALIDVALLILNAFFSIIIIGASLFTILEEKNHLAGLLILIIGFVFQCRINL